MDVIIGDGHKGNLTICVGGDHTFSENSDCYWVTDSILGVKGVIFKNTKEGKKITESLAMGFEAGILQSYIDKVLISTATVAHIYPKVLELKEREFRNGKAYKINEIKSILELR